MRILTFIFFVLSLIDCSQSGDTNKSESTVNNIKADSTKKERSEFDSSVLEEQYDTLGFSDFFPEEVIRGFSQIRIPLDNDNGVPYYKDQLGVFIFGFDVDTEGNFYFIGGMEGTILTKFSRDKKLLFRKELPNINYSTLHNFNDSTIVIFEDLKSKNKIYYLDNRNGEVIFSSEKVLNNAVYAVTYSDSTIIVKVSNIGDSINLDTEYGYVLLDIRGNIIKQTDNLFFVPNNILKFGSDSEKIFSNHLVGLWKGMYLKWTSHEEGSMDKFILFDEDGMEKGKKEVDGKKFGPQNFLDLNPSKGEHVKLTSDKVYILMQGNREAIINIIDLKEFF